MTQFEGPWNEGLGGGWAHKRGFNMNRKKKKEGNISPSTIGERLKATPGQRQLLIPIFGAQRLFEWRGGEKTNLERR